MGKDKSDQGQNQKSVDSRTRAAENRKEALQAIRQNEQFTKSTFWKKVNYDLLEQIKQAIHEGQIASLEKEIEKKDGERSELQQKLEELKKQRG